MQTINQRIFDHAYINRMYYVMSNKDDRHRNGTHSNFKRYKNPPNMSLIFLFICHLPRVPRWPEQLPACLMLRVQHGESGSQPPRTPRRSPDKRLQQRPLRLQLSRGPGGSSRSLIRTLTCSYTDQTRHFHRDDLHHHSELCILFLFHDTISTVLVHVLLCLVKLKSYHPIK